MTVNRKEMGDWQTPLCFAELCCNTIRNRFGFVPSYVLEPTCGQGNFIEAALQEFPDASILGLEINPNYVSECSDRFAGHTNIEIRRADYLRDGSVLGIPKKEATLILGNPPWVTNSELSSLDSANLPSKHNFKGLRGIDAMTGESNFDICEWIILHSLEICYGGDDMLAMLCKTSVARNICIFLAKSHQGVGCTILNFDSKKVFGISAAACLLICDFRQKLFSVAQGELQGDENLTTLVFNGKTLQEELPEHLKGLHGKSQLEWRQGVKHDCSLCMELKCLPNGLYNKLGEQVSVEEDKLYPYVKSSTSRRYVIDGSDMLIPMTQSRIAEDTSHLEISSPRLWNYLESHSDLFESRKSSIYKKAPKFAMFGVGDYSYSQYKVAVSGFYKDPIFSLTSGNRPIMFDDTCYFLAFNREGDAKVCCLLLNTDLIKEFYSKIAFLDSKRPFSKKVLAQLDFSKAIERITLEDLNATAESLNIGFRVSKSDLENFEHLVKKTLF